MGNTKGGGHTRRACVLLCWVAARGVVVVVHGAEDTTAVSWRPFQNSHLVGIIVVVVEDALIELLSFGILFFLSCHRSIVK